MCPGTAKEALGKGVEERQVHIVGKEGTQRLQLGWEASTRVRGGLKTGAENERRPRRSCRTGLRAAGERLRMREAGGAGAGKGRGG